ncbi:MAG: hypothetical protein FJ290_26600, partial [Planctomycetes bacterium]|nr:hypothetical protein [Planctomycetota bacterium]
MTREDAHGLSLLTRHASRITQRQTDGGQPLGNRETEMTEVGFIGLGIMGLPMARNLTKAGFRLTIVAGHAREAVKALQAAGAAVVASPREVAAGTELVVTCLPDTPDVRQVVTGADGLLAGAEPGLIVVDHSTI